ncbi:c-type cytochrome [Hydrogenimonas urashimensis]|uniref:c-type cytochrome n=1 Tax=Hydrogenimonas urashimensis TaxID=2740515 RepID=UPI0019165747|nr:c-type cytochrome [Hydrogenimonas urashimensis]
MKRTVWLLLLLILSLRAEDFSLAREKRYLAALDTIMNKIDKERLAQMGKTLFMKKCAFCHGKDGRGRQGFAADLTRRISSERALLNIQKGARNFVHSYPGGMPPMVPDRIRAEAIADYVASGFPETHEGAALYEKAHCARCHGREGRGIRYRAPNIRHFDLVTVAAILKNGKFGILGRMPAYSRLAPYQVSMLALYIMKISRGASEEIAGERTLDEQ